MVNLAGGKFAVSVFTCLIVLGLGIAHFLSSVSLPVRVGERQVYGIYCENTKIGTLIFQVIDTAVVENVNSFVSTYSLFSPLSNEERSGTLKFDFNGNLRRAVIAEVGGGVLKWRTEVGYSFSDELMRVILEDNRDPENYIERDTYINLTAEIMVPEHVWYFLRFEPLGSDYRHEFYLNLLPDALLSVKVAFHVAGEEEVNTPAGSWSCWVIEGENTQLASWPVDKIWVDKESALVVKAVENQSGYQVVYLLEEN